MTFQPTTDHVIKQSPLSAQHCVLSRPFVEISCETPALSSLSLNLHESTTFKAAESIPHVPHRGPYYALLSFCWCSFYAFLSSQNRFTSPNNVLSSVHTHTRSVRKKVSREGDRNVHFPLWRKKNSFSQIVGLGYVRCVIVRCNKKKFFSFSFSGIDAELVSISWCPAVPNSI